MIAFAVRQQGLAVEYQHLRFVVCLGLEGPFVGRYQPGPAENLVGPQRLHDQRRPHDGGNLHLDGAGQQDVEMLRRIFLPEQHVAASKDLFLGMSGQYLGVRGVEAGKNGMRLQIFF